MENPPDIGGPSDSRASTMAALRAAMPGEKAELLLTPYAIDAFRMILSGSLLPEVVREFSLYGVSTSVSALKRLKPLVEALPEGLKAEMSKCEPLVGKPEKTALQVLKRTMQSVADRIQSLEEAIDEAKEKKEPPSERRDDQLLKYYTLYADLRKQVERESLESEVTQAYRRGASDMAVLAMDFIQDDKAKRKFLEKIRDHERRIL